MSEGLTPEQLAAIEQAAYKGVGLAEVLALLHEIARLDAECKRRAVLVYGERNDWDTKRLCPALRMTVDKAIDYKFSVIREGRHILGGQQHGG